MSPWPSMTDYQDALQSPGPAGVFKDPRLQVCEVEKRKGQPDGRSGGFAIVFKLTSGSSATAVRFFQYPQPKREEYYQAVSQHLQRNRPSCIVQFAYDPEGIRIADAWYPVQTMEWVNGINLGEWIKECVQQQESNRLAAMADCWVDLLEQLRTCRIAHGDLQHDNVLVVNDTPVLVDYDCMCVPKLVGRVSMEEGKPAYQHPRRKDQNLSLEMDHFSAWIILIALRSLAADVTLWTRYVDQIKNESLLFTPADMDEPDRSALWPELLASRDPDVRQWARQLRDTLPDKPFAQIPRFELDVFRPLRMACQAAARDWDLIHRLALQPRAGNKALPPELVPLVDEAGRRVACRDRLQQAVARGGVRPIAAAYDPGLLDDWAACGPLVARAREARTICKILERLEAALRHTSDGRELVALWAKHATKLGQLPEAGPLRKAASSWEARIKASDAFLATLSQTQPSERAIADAWDKLVKLGGHPDADRHRHRAEQARVRAARLQRLCAVPTADSEDNDRELHEAWDEAVLKDCEEAASVRPRYDAACQRLRLLRDLQKVVDQADAGQGDENDVQLRAARLPPNYPYRLATRVHKARQRVAVTAELARALSAATPSDRAIAAAWEKATAAGCRTSDGATRERCELAVRRRDRLRKLEVMDPALPLDRQDQLWLHDWDTELLSGCPDAAQALARWQLAKERVEAWHALAAVLRARDTTRIGEVSANPLLTGYPPADQAREQIDELLQRAESINRIATLLRAGDSTAFAMGADLQFLRDNHALFQAHRSRIESLLESWLRNDVRLRPGDPPYLPTDRGTQATARWVWPHSHRISHCRVATDPGGFLTKPTDAVNGTSKLSAELHRFAGGFALHVLSHGRKVYVTVWPVIDLGWTELVGQPLHLGPVRLELRPSSRRA